MPKESHRRRATERAQSSKPGLSTSESPLAWLARRRDKDGQPLLSPAQFDAGERLRADFSIGQMTPRVTTDYSGMTPRRLGRRAAPDVALNQSDRIIAAQERVRRALAAVGPELSGILVDVCCHLKGLEDIERAREWPQRSAKVILLMALDGLARHYGFAPPVRPDASARLRHWGAADYRPTLDDWAVS